MQTWDKILYQKKGLFCSTHELIKAIETTTDYRNKK